MVMEETERNLREKIEQEAKNTLKKTCGKDMQMIFLLAFKRILEYNQTVQYGS